MKSSNLRSFNLMLSNAPIDSNPTQKGRCGFNHKDSFDA